jgi:hypothetical protein
MIIVAFEYADKPVFLQRNVNHRWVPMKQPDFPGNTLVLIGKRTFSVAKLVAHLWKPHGLNRVHIVDATQCHASFSDGDPLASVAQQIYHEHIRYVCNTKSEFAMLIEPHPLCNSYEVYSVNVDDDNSLTPMAPRSLWEPAELDVARRLHRIILVTERAIDTSTFERMYPHATIERVAVSFNEPFDDKKTLVDAVRAALKKMRDDESTALSELPHVAGALLDDMQQLTSTIGRLRLKH